MPLKANRGGDGGRSGSSLMSVLSTEKGTAGQEGVSPPGTLMLLLGITYALSGPITMGYHYTRHTVEETAALCHCCCEGSLCSVVKLVGWGSHQRSQASTVEVKIVLGSSSINYDR